MNTENIQPQIEMPRYKSHKEVWATKIKNIIFDSDIADVEDRETDGSAKLIPEEPGFAEIKVDASYVRKHDPKIGGYYVVYKDGYKSFSPAEAFEEGYTRVTPEKKIEVGDTVNVFFYQHNALFGYKVEYIPSAVGDSWRLSKDEKLVYVQLFDLIEKVK